VTQTADGGYILAGYTTSFGAGLGGFWLVTTDSGGNRPWSRTFGGSYNEICYSVQQTADGGYILGGLTQPFGFGNDDFWLVKTNPYGDSLWSRTFGGSYNDDCYSVQQTADGGYILGGYTISFGAGSRDFWLVKTGPDCYGPPVPPVVRLATVGADAQLYWSGVTENTFGCPISVTEYLVYYSASFAGPYLYLDHTADTTYTHVDGVTNNARMFYNVTATTAPLREE
ncbi:MAG: hypothetical protein NT025_06815, partial [bacterium]|nr:hypothetical protein [bacterium]